MQVMPATGKDMAVGDITDLEPNIHAGVKYIRFMVDKFYANEPMDQLNKGLFAFASYNAGPNRIQQLRKMAAKSGLDPNLWFNKDGDLTRKCGCAASLDVWAIRRFFACPVDLAGAESGISDYPLRRS